MERGEIGIDAAAPYTVFIFEGLVGHLDALKLEAGYRRLSRWRRAALCWEIDFKVCDHIQALRDHEVPVSVVTWREPEFAEALHDVFSALDVPVERTVSSIYSRLSQHLATDNSVNTVYDPDPAHRMGYGFKAREFSLGSL